MSKPEPEPFMARLLIDSLQHQLAVLTQERDEARADAKRVWDAGTDEHVVGHWRGIAERLAESRDELKHKVRGLEKVIATLTEALEKIAGITYYEPRQIAMAALAAVREPIEYQRCTCDHPGDTPRCAVDHDEIQHEQLTSDEAILLAKAVREELR